MNEDELRIKIYEHLGLEVGSLSSESGNDWVRAKNEILEESKRSEFKKTKDLEKVDYLKIPKSESDYISVLKSKSHSIQDYKVIIAQRKDLNEDEISDLITSGSKEVIMSLVKNQKLSGESINQIIPNSVYLTKKYLIEYQSLSASHKTLLLNAMNQYKETYKDLIIKIEG